MERENELPDQQVSVDHHYVPQWYQRNFLPNGKGEFFVFDKAPITKILCPDKKWRSIDNSRVIRRSGTQELFQREHLYALNLPFVSSDFLEKHLFGAIDDTGAIANRVLLNWPITIPMPKGDEYPFEYGDPNDRLMELLEFINAQKMRTPRGLDNIKEKLTKAGAPKDDNNIAMAWFNENKSRLCTVWAEAHWEVFGIDENSTTSFLLSDDPVTLYNMDSFPASAHCRYPNDPDPFWRGTRVLFPLSSKKLLVLSHKEHIDDPSRAKARKLRRNAREYDQTIFSFTWVSHRKMLSTDEVTEVNRILKLRAVRFVAAYDHDILYPEKIKSERKWSDLDSLFQPEYPSSHTSSEVHFGFADGRSRAFNAFGEEIESRADEMRARLDTLLERERDR